MTNSSYQRKAQTADPEPDLITHESPEALELQKRIAKAYHRQSDEDVRRLVREYNEMLAPFNRREFKRIHGVEAPF